MRNINGIKKCAAKIFKSATNKSDHKIKKQSYRNYICQNMKGTRQLITFSTVLRMSNTSENQNESYF